MPAATRPSPSLPAARRADAQVDWLTVRGAAHNNLKDIDVAFPLGRFVCVTGVSGSGKSSLVNDILHEQLARDLNGAEATQPGRHRAIDGKQHVDKIIAIDQSPIGRTPRSNPATYIKVFDEIRDLFARLPDANVRGYKAGRFSFNVKGEGRMDSASAAGRCEACEGNGSNRIEMDFLADVWVTCPVCNGRRFNRETLAILFKGKSIADVLEMDVQQALEHFENVPKVADMLRTLHDVGLDYIKLGQPSTTLSGGEAQRIKLARELVRKATGRTLYVLDEPTTGLHFEDIRRLLQVLHGFVDAGNSVVVIEHNLDVIKTADWVIDLGPEGGAGGGEIVAEGTPEEVARCERSHTGLALHPVLAQAGPGSASAAVGSAAAKAKKSKASRDASSRSGSSSPEAFGAPPDVIRVVGAREHNLKDVNVDIPRHAMTVCCGVSGSGKSSLALDTVYVEGQRRYVESLSAYARQFLGQFQKPRVDHVFGLSPAIAIEQKSASKSPRSTVGTVTEIYDYMRVLWARLGQAYCPECRRPIGAQTSDEIVESLMALPDGARVLLCAPIDRGQSESYDALLARCRANGYARIRIDGAVHELSETILIDARRKHVLEVVFDRVIVRPRDRARIADSVEHCLSVGSGVMIVVAADDADATKLGLPRRMSQRFSCDQCGRGFEELTPHHFSFNSRLGWCPTCEGLGIQRGTSAASVALRPDRSVLEGAIAGWGLASTNAMLRALIDALARHIGFDPSKPWSTMSDAQRHAILYGTGTEWIDVELPRNGDDTGRAAGSASTGKRRSLDTQSTLSGTTLRIQFKGFFPAVDEATRVSWQHRMRLENLVTDIPCQICDGSRLRRESAAARMVGKTIGEVCDLSLADALAFFNGLRTGLTKHQKAVAGELLHEISARLRFLVDVGLDYLTLGRSAPTLSGGESQRIRLASQIGSGLTGVLYVLDEPTIGLHPRDNRRLIAALKRLRDLGNTLLMVEHDREVIEAADHLLDFGPGAGREGGRITAAGTPAVVRRAADSLTGQYLSNRQAVPVPTNRRPVDDDVPRLTVIDARQNNLRNVDVSVPLGRFVCVTGVSGSGKSSLITDTLFPVLSNRIHRTRLNVGAHGDVRGLDHVDKVINVDQAPIGNSPLSNPSTYCGIFDLVRELFARLPASKVRGFNANRFSFNRPGGRCEACEGLGQVCHEMHFLPDVWVECDTCHGRRYNPETLEVLYKDKSITDVLEMRVSDALEHFANVPKLRRLLQTLVDVGLGYVQLGQSAPTLSGGEAQRVKLAAELGRPSTGRTIYLLDEPTTGLHFDDLRKLLEVLHRFVDLGNTVVCVEHNLEVIKTADWLIDLGPEAGEAGGRVVVAGTPEVVAACRGSHTGGLLADVLRAGPRAERPKYQPAAEPARGASASIEPTDVETDATMPWQRDGRRWHTRDRVSRCGETIEWDGEALEFVVEQIERFGGKALAPTDWKDRSRVEIKAVAPSGLAAAAVPWLFHALTGSRWLLDLTFRVPTRTFSQAELNRRLALRSLDDRSDLPIYGKEPRVRVASATSDTDRIRILVHDRPEVTSKGFREFLKTAVARYVEFVSALARDKARAQPWTVDGRGWHLSQKSMARGQQPMWKPMVLVELLGRMSRIDPGLTPDWSRKVVVIVRDRSGDAVAHVVTNDRQGVRVVVPVRLGAVTPTQIESLGMAPRITTREAQADVQFWVQEIEQVPTAALEKVLRAAIRRGAVGDADNASSAGRVADDEEPSGAALGRSDDD